MSATTNSSLRNQVIYQIFTRNYKEGTFKAVEADLDRIQSLGVDIIYLLPIQPSGVKNRKGSVGSPYAISDYRAVDKMQGSLEDFSDLCDAVHKKGMKIIIDVVYNHTSPDSVLSSTNPEWFYHKADGSFGNRIGDWWDVIDLDYDNADLWNYQIETLKIWAKYVDGFRCDVAPILPLDFWLRAKKEVEEIRPGCLWIAESVEPKFITFCRKQGINMHSDSELYQAFDICYDYDVYDDMADVMYGNLPLSHYLEKVNAQEYIYPNNYVKLRCLENHDRSRAATMIPDKKTLLNWTAFNYFLKGTAMIYAGQECMATHHPTLFDVDRVDFDVEADKDISGFLAKLSSIKKNHTFTDSSFSASTIGNNNEIIYAVHESRDPEEKSIVKAVGIFSTTGAKQAIKVDLPNGSYKNAITDETIDVFEGVLRYDGDPIIIFVSSADYNNL